MLAWHQNASSSAFHSLGYLKREQALKSLGTKLFLLLSSILVLFTLLLAWRSYTYTRKHALEGAVQEAEIALQFNLAVRKYIGEKVRPFAARAVHEGEFIPELMSTSYVARSVFEDVRLHIPGFILKFSSENPRNPANLAGPEELKIIDIFNKNPDMDRWSGNITINGKPYFGLFSARRMEQSCLQCHGTPDDAPLSILEQYGREAGFYRPLGKVIALDTVGVPLGKINTRLWQELRTRLFILATGCLILLIITFLVVKIFVSNRLHKISDHFKVAAAAENGSQVKPLEIDGEDEISSMAESFNALASRLGNYHLSLQHEIENNIRINQDLRFEISERQLAEAKKEKAIADLEKALQEIKKLQGILPICCHCKKIRDDKGCWNQIEVYVRAHSEAEFTHGICPDCLKERYHEYMPKE